VTSVTYKCDVGHIQAASLRINTSVGGVLTAVLTTEFLRGPSRGVKMPAAHGAPVSLAYGF